MSSDPRASLRASAVPPFQVMEVMKAAHERERSGKKVLHMEVGQPSAGAPQGVLDAVKESLDACARGETTLGYTVADGTDALRSRISAHYASRYGVSVSPDAIMVTTGSSAAFVLGFLAMFDAGDRVAVARPGYPCYVNILEAMGVEVVSLPVNARTNFQPTVEMLEDAVRGDDDGNDDDTNNDALASESEPGSNPAGGKNRRRRKLRGVIVASPSNPTGTVLARDQLFALREWCGRRGAWFVSDEIYHQIEYGPVRAATALERANSTTEHSDADAYDDGGLSHVAVINSFSKYHCLTGWRVGWCVLPKALREPFRALQQNLFINAPHVSQIAALAAFECDEALAKHVERYERNREILLRGLKDAGFGELSSAGGAYYVYADVSGLTDDSVALCARILETTGVACVPGVDFDRERGRRFVRFSFCGSEETAREAAKALAQKRDEWAAKE